MKLKFKNLAISITVLACFALLFGCSNKETKEPTKDYSNEINTFKLSLAGEWELAPSLNEQNITINNSDKTLTITLQGFPKDLPNMQVIKDLDSFITFCRKSVLVAFEQKGTFTDLEDVTIEGVKAKGYELSATENDIASKAYITFIDTDNCYYLATIAGVADKYDKNITSLKDAIKSIKELK